MVDRKRRMSRSKAGRPSGPDRDRSLQSIRSLLAEGRLADARAAAEIHVRAHRRDAAGLRLRALLEDRCGNTQAASESAQRAEAIEPHPDSLCVLGDIARRQGRSDDAIAACRAALELDPNHLPASMVLAEALESAVRLDELEPLLDQLESSADRVPPQMAITLHTIRAAALIHRGRHREAIERLDSRVLVTGLPEARRRPALRLRAKACDREGRYDEAFGSAAEANRLSEAFFDPIEYGRQVRAIETHWTRSSMASFPSSGLESERCVFIAGMPRSGTSLLDQVIDAHPEAAGVGELDHLETFARHLEQVWRADLPPPRSFGPLGDGAFRECAERYESACAAAAPTASRIVNKALGNNRIVGLLARLFPRTSIVHAVRDPRDVAISCFMGDFNSEYYPWTTRLDWTAAAWAQSRRLMDHWRRETDLPILEIRYEELVSDPATQFPRLVSFLGLAWDEGCTRFHESRRTVRTLSYDQVNRPLYTSSVARWQHYEKHLGRVDWMALIAGQSADRRVR